MAKYRVGDEVTVRGIVTGQSPHVGPIVEFRRDNEFNSTISFAVPVEYIVTHTPKPREFKPGDKVTYGYGAEDLEFIAERDGFVIMWHQKTKSVYRELRDNVRHATKAD